MRAFWSLLLAASCAWSSGCGSSESTKPPVDLVKEKTVSTNAELKKRLEDIAVSGASGSGLMGIKESIDQAVRNADAKLADELTKDVNLLSQTTDPAEIKTIATRMASKL